MMEHGLASCFSFSISHLSALSLLMALLKPRNPQQQSCQVPSLGSHATFFSIVQHALQSLIYILRSKEFRLKLLQLCHLSNAGLSRHDSMDRCDEPLEPKALEIPSVSAAISGMDAEIKKDVDDFIEAKDAIGSSPSPFKRKLESQAERSPPDREDQCFSRMRLASFRKR